MLVMPKEHFARVINKWTLPPWVFDKSSNKPLISSSHYNNNDAIESVQRPLISINSDPVDTWNAAENIPQQYWRNPISNDALFDASIISTSLHHYQPPLYNYNNNSDLYYQHKSSQWPHYSGMDGPKASVVATPINSASVRIVPQVQWQRYVSDYSYDTSTASSPYYNYDEADDSCHQCK